MRIRRLGIVLIVATLLAGCGGGSTSSVGNAGSTDPAPVPSPAAAALQTADLTVVHSHPPSDAVTVVVTARDEDGAPTFVSPALPVSAQPQTVRVPVSVATVDVEYHAADSSISGRVTSAVDVSSGAALLRLPAPVKKADGTLLSFVFFGCNRISGAKKSNPSTANQAQLVRDFHEVVDAKHFKDTALPSLVLLMGDLVENLKKATDGDLGTQLTAWIALEAATDLGKSTTTVGAVAGNHEFCIKLKGDDDSSDEVEIPNPVAGPVWSAAMAKFILNHDGPVMGGSDPIQRDESTLSYTYTANGVMWIMLDTDTYEGGTSESDTALVALHWAQTKIVAANANPAIQHIFVLGHRPLLSPEITNPGINSTQASQLYATMNDPTGQGTGTKVRAYLCAHAHQWHESVLTGLDPKATVPQIIAGNGGSEPAGHFNKPYFGYTEIDISTSGAVSLVSWGRKVPDPYDSTDKQPDSTVREQMTIYSP